MSSRRDNRKVMDMLEKMGMVKKTEDDEAETGYRATTAVITLPEPSTVQTAVQAATRLVSPQITRQEAGQPVRQEIPQLARQEATQIRADKTYGVSERVLGKSFWEDESIQAESGPDADVFTEVIELYKRFSLKLEGIDTVYLLEEYIRTLPESLPPEMRRNIVLKIVAASGFDFDRLLNDGIDRVARLNDYSAEFAAHTEEVLARYNGDIESLQHKIERIRETINERKNLHKRQFLEIEDEAKRLKDILDFFTK